MRAASPLSWLGRGGPPVTESIRRRRRLARTGVVLALSTVLTVTTLSTQSVAIPGDSLKRELKLPDLPEQEPVEQNENAEKELTTADKVPVTPYTPKNVTPWQQDVGVVDLTEVAPGQSVKVADLPVSLGVPEGADPAALDGQWQVSVAAPETSQEVGVAGLIMRVTPPETADPAASVAMSVDTKPFADLYGPQAADRFGLTLLPECVLTAPDSGDCAPAEPEGATPMTGGKAPKFERLASEVKTVQTAASKKARNAAAKDSATGRVVTGSVSVASLFGEAGPRKRITPLPQKKNDDAAPKPAPSAPAAPSTAPEAPVEKTDPQVPAPGETGDGDAREKAEKAAGGEGDDEPRNTVDTGDGVAEGRTAALNAGPQAGSGQVVGAMDTGASSSGDYTATPLQSAGSWAAGSSNGAFTYSYQVQTPEAPGGLTPKIGLGYSSQAADGRTSASNNQSSWIGEGWDYNAGSITRTFTSCRQDSQKAGSNNKEHKTADLCWGSNNATLTLGGSTSELVWDDSKNTWTTANGDNSKVELLKNTNLKNGDADGEYWVVTTKDGTRYYFGLNKLPGWSDKGTPDTKDDDPVTNSVLNVPVYGNHPGEACYKAGDWKNSGCVQGWRFNLDYVEDVNGNAMTFWWQKETNYYARNFDFKAPVVYDRGGYLTRIDYGQRKESIFSAEAIGRVQFKTAERCFEEAGVTCTDENFAAKDPGKFRIWYDTPADLRCAPDPKVKCWNSGPAFFSRKRLDSIVTSAQRLESTQARQVVDEYQLKQSFPVLKTGPNTALWLESITRTGYGRKGTTDAKVTVPAVRFESNVDDMPNRVMLGANDPTPGFSRLRIGRVINEHGGETVVSYRKPEGDCATGVGLPTAKDKDALKANARLCYPTFWHPDPEKEDQISWFHKYVVEKIEELPNVDGAFANATGYEYKNPGWKLAESEFTKPAQRTYSQFAGFEQTTVNTGVKGSEDAGLEDPKFGGKRTKSVTRYYRGLGDDVPVKDITGTEIGKDHQAFAGRIAEELSYTDPDATPEQWVSRSYTTLQAVELAKRVRGDGLSDLRAWRVLEPIERAFTKSSGTGDDKRTERSVETKTTYEPTYGLPIQVESLGDTGKDGDEACVRSEYLHQTERNIIGLSKQVLTSPTTCAAADFANLKSLVSGERTAYDNKAWGVSPASDTRAKPTETWRLKADGTGFDATGKVEFDSIGRVVKTIDPEGRVSSFGFEPATGQVFKSTEKNVLGHEQTQEIEPGRGVAVKTTDTNGRVSLSTFDPLGRMVEAWAPGRSAATHTVPDFRAEYTLREGKPPYVTTYTRGHLDKIETDVTLYDGLGRERQTQEESPGGRRQITDTLYNSSGEIWQTNNAYLADGKPSGELFTPLADTTMPNVTRYTYDNLGRVQQELPVLNGVDKPERATRYEYGLDYSTVINPAGAPSYRVYSDALGRTARVDTYTDASRQSYTSLKYEYDSRGDLVKAWHSADDTHPWTWTFDAAGRQTSATDPDTGTTRTTYDRYDRPVTVTNARGVTAWTDYDALSRPTQNRLDGPTGTLLADFTYDTVPGAKGLPATATRYTDGLAYTQKINGYTDDYQPTSTTLTLPQSLADTWGLQSTYTHDYKYTDTGLLDEATIPAVGKMASERMIVRYNEDGRPESISGKDWYGAETVYDPHGQVLRSTLGAQPYRVWAQNSYDEASGALTDQQVFREQTGEQATVQGNLVSHRSYWYDAAGNVTSIRERSTGIEERQCFAYDPLGQLRSAWTSGDQASCQAGPKGPDGKVTVAEGKDKTGYWQEYEYDLLGNRTKLTERNLAGDTAKDTVTEYGYGKGAEKAQPHTLTKVTKKYTTPAGAQITAEAERLYDLTGETKSVTSTASGDKQQLTWTYDGQIERVTGTGANGKTSYVGPAQKCIDVKSGVAAANQPIQLYTCNGTAAQRWTFTPTPNQTDPNLGTMSALDEWCLQPTGNTAGSAFQIRTCDGSAAQQLTRNAAGQLTHKASGLCMATSGAATTDGTLLVLATCAGTSAAQLWEPQNDTRHIYGPAGRLLTITGKQATLYLGETKVTTQKAGVLVSTQRSYAVPGGSVVRYSYGNGGEALAALTSDHQGSPVAEVAMAANMDVRVTKQDPFGNTRGVPNGTKAAVIDKGFLGAPKDASSGYQILGARMYDPVVGRFLSSDPVLEIADPLALNGYTYAHNNPVTLSDPSGLSVSLTPSELSAALAGVGLSAAQVAQAQATMNTSLTDIILGAAWGILKEFTGIGAAMGCFGGDMWSCIDVITDLVPWKKLYKLGKVLNAVRNTFKAIDAWKAAKKVAEKVIATAKAAEKRALEMKKKAIEEAKKKAAQLKKKADEARKRASQAAANKTKKTGNTNHKQAQAKANPKVSTAKSVSGGGGKSKTNSGGTGGRSGATARNGGGSSGSGGSGKASGGSCPVNSFAPGTKVLMADGTTKAIEDVKAGDQVVATDERTGRNHVKTVTAEITGQGRKNLVTVTFESSEEQGGTGEIVATEGHPFWVPELGQWLDAKDLLPGQLLRTSAGTFVQIKAVERWTAADAVVHNLTVSDKHTYYVVSAGVPVLVHNADLPDLCGEVTPKTHFADVEVLDEHGTVIDSYSLRSGARTPAEAALKEGQVRIATHTEHRAARAAGGAPMVKDTVITGDEFFMASPVPFGGTVRITGTKAPCGNCQRAMNLAAEDTASTFIYIWKDEKTGQPRNWISVL
ncbi:ricin-type beta-trefoil lectin domain protein [Streptomyces sp. BI20]|uniref:ricin-type beta-trefoil lectin domain protein n=1 Tax=Streptomyces sp. BI20 TaxID=3403460 RepID=UPI003C72E606